MIDLSQTYRHLGRPWTHEELAVRYSAADRRGEQLLSESTNAIPERPIALLATAIPSVATLSVAIHLVHAILASARAKLADELLDTAEINAADALHRVHRALELDGHGTGIRARLLRCERAPAFGSGSDVRAAVPLRVCAVLFIGP